MILDETSNYYEILEIAPDASPQEIRSAYLRAKSAYKKDSVAIYTLIDESETEALLRRIEEAYQVLASPEKRKDYDRKHGNLLIDEKALARSRPPRHNQKIVSIDRVPPMDLGTSDEALLVAPSTDFTSGEKKNTGDMFGASEAPLAATTRPAPTPPPAFAPTPTPAIQTPPPAQTTTGHAYVPAPTHQEVPPPPAAPTFDFSTEVEWKGVTLRKIREIRNVSVEELCDFTKISKTYLRAVEEENFAKLPAAVFTRGFIIQIAKYLRLPHDKVSAAYMSRFNQSKTDR